MALLLERAVATGESAPLDIAWSADAILAPLTIDLYLFQRRERGFAPERLAAALRQFLARLRAGAAPVEEAAGESSDTLP